MTDAEGGLWRLATWDAEYSPSDPEALFDKNVAGVDFDKRSEILTVRFSDAASFTATPVRAEDDDVENWELFTPEGSVLVYGARGLAAVQRQRSSLIGGGVRPFVIGGYGIGIDLNDIRERRGPTHRAGSPWISPVSLARS